VDTLGPAVEKKYFGHLHILKLLDSDISAISEPYNHRREDAKNSVNQLFLTGSVHAGVINSVIGQIASGATATRKNRRLRFGRATETGRDLTAPRFIS